MNPKVIGSYTFNESFKLCLPTVTPTDTKYDVITSPFLWILSFLFLMMKMEMASCEDWGQLYLVQEKQFPVTIGKLNRVIVQ